MLDVGHGNSTLLVDGPDVTLVDAPLGAFLLDYLESSGISTVRRAIVSHTDQDHLGGMSSLLTSERITVKEVRVNPDPLKRSDSFQDFRVAAAAAERRGGTALHTEVTTSVGDSFSFGRVLIEVLHPAADLALSGVGGHATDGTPLSAHSLSVVLRVSLGGVPTVMLPGDLDARGLQLLLSRSPRPEMTAKVLVFPHHGGQPSGGNAFDFARQVCSVVQPEVVIFSIGRGKFQNPHPQTILGVRAASPNAHIACTQLSVRCALTLPTAPATHLSDRRALGRRSGACCAGTIVMTVDAGNLSMEPDRRGHEEYVRSHIALAMCQGRGDANDLAGKLSNGGEPH